MRVYENKCERCEIVFQTDSHINKTCPKCGKSGMVHRVWDNVAVIFKGNGFYTTDNRQVPKETAGEDG